MEAIFIFLLKFTIFLSCICAYKLFKKDKIALSSSSAWDFANPFFWYVKTLQILDTLKWRIMRKHPSFYFLSASPS